MSKNQKFYNALSEIEKILIKQKKEIKKKYKVKNIGIFGSYVRGDQNKRSDIDILVEFNEPIDFFLFLELEEKLSQILDLKVDLIMKKALKPGIGKHILKEVVYV